MNRQLAHLHRENAPRLARFAVWIAPEITGGGKDDRPIP